MGTLIPDPEICRKCTHIRKHLTRCLEKLHTGDPTLDNLIRALVPDAIPEIVHGYYGLKTDPTKPPE